jgi:hypothetical protein
MDKRAKPYPIFKFRLSSPSEKAVLDAWIKKVLAHPSQRDKGKGDLIRECLQLGLIVKWAEMKEAVAAPPRADQ